MHQNIDWLTNKTDRFAHFLKDINPDFVVITEHGLSEQNLLNTRIEGFSLVGGFARQNHIKGGVAGFVKDKFQEKVKLLETGKSDSELTCEVALFEVTLKKGTLLVLGTYRPPNAKLESGIDILCEMLERALKTEKPIILLGDINVDNLCQNNDNTKLTEALLCYNITRLSIPATRITSTTQKSIDWVCTNMEENYLQIKVLESGLSDHTAQLIKIKSEKEESTNHREKKRCINKETVQLLKDTLREEDWQDVINAATVDSAYNTFHNIFQAALNFSCPYKTPRNRKRAKNCWNRECEELRKTYLQALEQEKRTGCVEDKRETTKRKKAYDLKLKASRKEQAAKHIEESDNKSKALWTIVNRERGKKSQTESKIHIQTEGTLLKDPLAVANHLNKYFASVADRTLVGDVNKGSQTQDPQGKIKEHLPRSRLQRLSPTTQGEVRKIIHNMKPKTSSGVDGVSARLAKSCMEEIVMPLTSIINKSFEQGIFPNNLKVAKIYPKYKSGPKTEANSYRPISLIPTFSKIIEKLALIRLLKHLEDNQLLTTQQHGFIKGRSTITAIIQLIEHVIDKIEEGCKVTSFFLDFSKFFDCLDPAVLKEKMQELGITGEAESWFDSYGGKRRQLVELKHTIKDKIINVQSDYITVTKGVAQGSILGPPLSLLATNDMPTFLQMLCQVVMYVDDTVMTLGVKERDQTNIQSQIAYNTAKQYCNKNSLVLNEQKSVQMVYNLRGGDEEGLPDIKIETTTKYLGITLDSRLSWKPHIDQLCKKTQYWAICNTKS